MTELDRDLETLREACASSGRATQCLGALDRVVAALRGEQEAKQLAIERWRSRAQEDGRLQDVSTPRNRRVLGRRNRKRVKTVQ